MTAFNAFVSREAGREQEFLDAHRGVGARLARSQHARSSRPATEDIASRRMDDAEAWRRRGRDDRDARYVRYTLEDLAAGAG